MTDNIYWRALDRLDRGKKWTKGMYSDSIGNTCLVGCLIEDLQSIYAEKCSSFSRDSILDKVIQEQFPERDRIHSITHFNDHRDTTWEDVRLVLEKSAIWLDEVVES